ncbi:MAG: nuclear transport factor 2 family protein [Dehalococcoidia bacterium]|nr:nuclear transport factor 2 family protein [Dehalococcoidia bacterium]
MAANDLEDMQRRVQLLEDERDIGDVFSRYSHTIDYGRQEEWADCFTEDGVFDVFTVDGRKVHKEHGRGELFRYLGGKKLPPQRYDKHVLAAPLIDVKGSTAKAQSYFIMFSSVAGSAPFIGVYGRYKDTLVKEGGRWYLKERLAEVERTPAR